MKRHSLFFMIAIHCLLQNASFSQDNAANVYAVKFTGYKTHLSKEAKATLSDVARVMKDQPNSHFAVTGYCITENQRMSQASWDRVMNIINHLVKKEGIVSDRFIFRYAVEGGDCNTVELSFTDEPIPTTVAPPHPNIRKKKENPCTEAPINL